MSVVAVKIIGRRRAFYVLSAGLVLYAIMVGASASVVRAALMGILLLWADYLGRPYAAPNALFATAFFMTLLDPNALFDVGFQLSFVATLGLMVYARPFARSTENWLARLLPHDLARSSVQVINDAVLVTLAAQVATLPLLMYYFRQLSTVALIVNPLVLPAQTGVMVFGLLALGGGLMALPLGQILGWLAWIFLTWTLGIIALFARLPYASIPLDYVPPIGVALYYGALIGLTRLATRTQEQRSAMLKHLVTPRRALVAAGLVAVLGLVAHSWRNDGRLHLYVLAATDHPVLVQTPGGRQVLIGGSSRPSELLAQLGQHLPFWDRDLDLLVVARAEAAQLNGLLAVLDRYTVGQIMTVDVPPETRAGRDWLAALAAQDRPPLGLQAAPLDAAVQLVFEGEVPRIEAGPAAIALGPGEQAQIAVLATPPERLPQRPQLLVTWWPVPDEARVLDLTGRGGLDVTVTPDGVSLAWLP